MLRPLPFLPMVLLVLSAAAASAADDALVGLASAESGERIALISSLAATRDARYLAFLDDYAQGSAYRWHGRIVLAPIVVSDAAGRGAIPVDALTREPLAAAVPMAELDALEVGRRERAAARDAANALRLFAPDREARLSAATRVGDAGDARLAPILDELAQHDADAVVRRAAHESALLLRLLDGDDAAVRRAAIAELGALGSGRALPKLQTLMEAAPDADTATATRAALKRIASWQATVRGVGHCFSGLSLGSILILMALGLAIAFGLMGVINMAHGELMMIGAYATFLTQKGFAAWLPASWFGAYFLVAIPVAALCAGTVGWLIELVVIRRLYGRPLETLLATYGVSLLLIQAIRCAFGDNRAVNSPAWLQGGVEVASGLVLPYARLFIIVFCAAAVAATSLVIGRTRLGLMLRATTQNRAMAAALGCHTRAIDGWAFAIGSGIAGMAGCALTLISNITPNMGQELVVDSFLVVVVGGVGKLAGVVIAGLGLGSLAKLFEPWTQAVWAKVLVLACVIAFIQWRPSGLFPQRGRMADA